MELLISLFSGAIGGNVAGGLQKKFDLGVLGNSIAGILGGGLGTQVISAAGASNTASTDIGTIITQVASGGVGGVVIMVMVGFIKSALVK